MKFADVFPDRWRTPPPHPNGWSGYQLPDHDTARIVYDGLPLVTLEDKLLYVAELILTYARDDKSSGCQILIRQAANIARGYAAEQDTQP